MLSDKAAEGRRFLGLARGFLDHQKQPYKSLLQVSSRKDQRLNLFLAILGRDSHTWPGLCRDSQHLSMDRALVSAMRWS